MHNVSSLHITERVYLGLAAIEHKRESSDVRDMCVPQTYPALPLLVTRYFSVICSNMLCYEMHLICKMQANLGIEHPLSFGIYWAGTRFLLYCMEVNVEGTGRCYVPHLLLQYSADKRSFLCPLRALSWPPFSMKAGN